LDQVMGTWLDQVVVFGCEMYNLSEGIMMSGMLKASGFLTHPLYKIFVIVLVYQNLLFWSTKIFKSHQKLQKRAKVRLSGHSEILEYLCPEFTPRVYLNFLPPNPPPLSPLEIYLFRTVLTTVSNRGEGGDSLRLGPHY